jgi:hypothetical protein
MMTGRMAAERSEWDGERARRVFEEANARYEASTLVHASVELARMSAFGTKRTWHSRSTMSAFEGKADIAI